jgi:hypothetical protein
MNPVDLVSTLTGLSVASLAALGALGTFCVALQAVLLVVARFVPQASPVARVLAVITTDLGKVATALGAAARWLGSRTTRPHGFAFVRVLAVLTGMAIWAPFVAYSCTPAQRALMVPSMSKIDAIGIAVSHAVGWCEAHGADATAVSTARKALVDRDPGTAISVIRKMLEATAAAGEPVPPELVATVELAEGLLAAKALQEGMQAITYLKTRDAGAP